MKGRICVNKKILILLGLITAVFLVVFGNNLIKRFGFINKAAEKTYYCLTDKDCPTGYTCRGDVVPTGHYGQGYRTCKYPPVTLNLTIPPLGRSRAPRYLTPSPSPFVQPRYSRWGGVYFSEEDQKKLIAQAKTPLEKIILEIGYSDFMTNIQLGNDYCDPKSTLYNIGNCFSATVTAVEIATAPVAIGNGVSAIASLAESAGGGITLETLSQAVYAYGSTYLESAMLKLPKNVLMLLRVAGVAGGHALSWYGVSECKRDPASDACAFLVTSIQLGQMDDLVKETDNLLKDIGRLRVNSNTFVEVYACPNCAPASQLNTDVQRQNFILQMNQYLASTPPYRILNYQGKQIPLWRSRQVLTEENWKLFSQMVSNSSGALVRSTGIPVDAESIMFTNDIKAISIFKTDSAALYLYSEKIYVIDVSQVYQGPNWLTQTATHEKIHQILDKTGLAQYITNLAQTPQQHYNFQALNEGLTQYLTEETMRSLGYTVTPGVYTEQVKAVKELIGGGKYSEFLLQAIKDGNFDYLLISYKWSTKNFINWILKNLPPISG